MKALKILVVEDNPVFQKQAGDQLMREHSVIVLDTFDWFQQLCYEPGEFDLDISKFDILLTDVNLPSLNRRGQPDNIAPSGLTVPFFAMKKGIKKIGVLTDVEHHPGAISRAIQALEVVEVGDTKIVFFACHKEKPWAEAVRRLME